MRTRYASRYKFGYHGDAVDFLSSKYLLYMRKITRYLKYAKQSFISCTPARVDDTLDLIIRKWEASPTRRDHIMVDVSINVRSPTTKMYQMFYDDLEFVHHATNVMQVSVLISKFQI